MAEYVVFPRRFSFDAEPKATAGTCGLALNELVAAQPRYAVNAGSVVFLRRFLASRGALAGVSPRIRIQTCDPINPGADARRLARVAGQGCGRDPR